MYFGAGAVLGNILTGRLYETMPMQQVFGIFSLLVLITGIASFRYWSGTPAQGPCPRRNIITLKNSSYGTTARTI